jgi:hypothetical protein
MNLVLQNLPLQPAVAPILRTFASTVVLYGYLWSYRNLAHETMVDAVLHTICPDLCSLSLTR